VGCQIAPTLLEWTPLHWEWVLVTIPTIHHPTTQYHSLLKINSECHQLHLGHLTAQYHLLLKTNRQCHQIHLSLDLGHLRWCVIIMAPPMIISIGPSSWQPNNHCSAWYSITKKCCTFLCNLDSKDWVHPSPRRRQWYSLVVWHFQLARLWKNSGHLQRLSSTKQCGMNGQKMQQHNNGKDPLLVSQ